MRKLDYKLYILKAIYAYNSFTNYFPSKISQVNFFSKYGKLSPMQNTPIRWIYNPLLVAIGERLLVAKTSEVSPTGALHISYELARWSETSCRKN